MTEDKPKRIRRCKYRFTGSGIRIHGGRKIKRGDVILLRKEQVTREYENAD